MLFVTKLKVYSIFVSLHLKNCAGYQTDDSGESWEDQDREREDGGQGS